MAPYENRTHVVPLDHTNMNLCDIDLSSHMNTMQIIVNQYFVAFDAGTQILKEFKVRNSVIPDHMFHYITHYI